ncbi:MAG TPA: histidine kinase dimerization/phosphoacceptor domain -containing protein [Balneolaceae bacterium]|nr:histidine kinase dimerization/phosphoacceptor domain -containing protein [Balneolaceae bacterium]
MAKIKEHDTSKRINLDRKMVGILSIFIILGICLVVSIIIATNTLSALRAYSTLQSNYTERRKEAVFQLVQYAQLQEPVYLQQFYKSLGIIDNARSARKELFKRSTDEEIVYQHLLKAKTVPANIGIMITAFERFHTFPDFKDAIGHWVESDRLVDELRKIAGIMQQEIALNDFSVAEQEQQIDRIKWLDRQLTKEQYKLAASLSSGTSLLNRIIWWISSMLGIILLATGSFLALRFLKSIKTWRRAIEVSNQRYKSLFEHNPFGVFQMLPSGEFLAGNKSLALLTGYSSAEISDMGIDQLISKNHTVHFHDLIKKTAAGKYQNDEIIWNDKEGHKLHIHLTLLPIYVDNNITGVFGIAEDISYKKYAEQKIKDQLEEKTHLLSEIHDRVKNNLALITGLLQLQKSSVDNAIAAEYLESAISRIYSMAKIHERLYHTETFSKIRMDEYIREFSQTVHRSFEEEPEKYKIDIQVDSVALGIKKAIPMALLLNEILVNAFKYAFIGKKRGTIRISLTQKENNEVTLCIADDGNGIGEPDENKAAESLGLQLIDILSQQLEASMQLENKVGTKYTFRFMMAE